jgi:molecular chaperone GrpE (heat shock protein)
MPNPAFDEILREIRGLRAAIEPIVKPPSAGGADLDESVDSLRRLLSELIEQRMEAVVQQVADIRRDASALPAEHATRIADRLDQLLESLGAERFDAEPMDMVDPLIHVVVAERVQQDVPDGVIVESVRPGYRTSRGRVVCKAAVAVSQRG